MTKNESQLHVRVPSELKSQLEIAAKEAGRSVNSEITQRLETSFTPYSPFLMIDKGTGDISAREQELLGMWRSVADEDRGALWQLFRRLAKLS